MAPTMKVKVNRQKLIDTIAARRDAARKTHEAKVKAETKEYTEAVKEYEKAVKEYPENVASFFEAQAVKARKLKSDEIAHRDFGYQVGNKMPNHPHEPNKPFESEFDSSGFDAILELLKMSTEDVLALSNMQYEAWMVGRQEAPYRRR